jgi:hypothetical protein
LERGDGRIPRAHDAIELGLGTGGTRLESRVPDVERLERSPEAPRDQRREVLDLLRAQNRDEERFGFLLGDLALGLERPRDSRGSRRCVCVQGASGVEVVEPDDVAAVGLALGPHRSLGNNRTLEGSHLVRLGAPEYFGVVDHDHRDFLADDSLHHSPDHALLDLAVGLAVVGSELVAQTPVRDHAQAFGERPLSVGRDQAIEPDVVLRDVPVRPRQRLGDRLQHGRRRALGETVHHPGPGPRLSTPRPTLDETVAECVDREVQQREERDLGFEEVVIRVDREVEVGEEPVRRGDGTGVKVARSEELAANLV